MISKKSQRISLKENLVVVDMQDEHKESLIDTVDENTSSLILCDMMESLTTQFRQLDIGKTSFYNLATKKCSINLKRAHSHPVERNNPDRIEE